MRQRRLNHNKDIMLGVMALAVVVLGVVVFFWMWCFPDGTPHEDAEKMDYRFLLADGFRGDSVQLRMNDSLVFSGKVPRDSLEISIGMPGEEYVLMVGLPQADRVSSFGLPPKGAAVLLRNNGGRVEMELQEQANCWP